MADGASGSTRAGQREGRRALLGCLVALLWGGGGVVEVGVSPAEGSMLATLAEESTVVQTTISAGFEHSCGVRTDGTLACWGRNEFGQASPPGAPSPS